MRAAVLFVVGLLLGACAHPPAVIIAPAASYEAQAADLASKTIALVAATEEHGVRPFCSGVWVGESLILTADHCVDDYAVGDEVAYATRPDVLNANHEAAEVFVPRTAKVKAHDSDHDLALLEVRDAPKGHGVALVSKATIKPGTFCQAMGHPLGLYYSYSVGVVAAVRNGSFGEPFVWIQATAPISPGNSGGGLFDVDGQLIGITSAAATRGQNVNVFVHRVHITALLT